MRIPFISILAISFLTFGADVPSEVTRNWIEREPYYPQKFDLGVAIGNAWSSSSYILVEGFGGYQTFSCGHHCFVYIDASTKIAAQRGQTHYIMTAGPRLQVFADGSLFGPYLRPFAGTNHYIFSGAQQDFGVVGAALGSFLFLHPAADLRMELAVSVGPIIWTTLSLGAVIKWRNL